MKESQTQGPYSEWRIEPDIPYKIRCTFNSEDGPLAGGIELNKQHPAQTLLTNDLPGPGRSLSMFFHHTIPEKYREIVYYHEKTEAVAMYGDRHLPQHEAHKHAVSATEEYVLNTLGRNGLRDFNQWVSSLSQ